jgi:S1-C subfamily serine protease
MNALRKYLLATALTLGALPALSAAAEPAPPPPAPPPPVQGQDLQRRLEEARRRLDEAAREVARLSGQMGRNFNFNFAAPVQMQLQPRALLGVNIENNSGDIRGALVRDVSPGSAAADAGIKAGDVITAIGGQDLTRESDAGRALVERMQAVEPNLKLQVDVLRDGKKMSFDVTPRPAPPTIITGVQHLPGGQGPGGVRSFQLQPDGQGPGAPGVAGERRIEIRTMRDGPDDGTRFRGLEFATLSEKLGSYFGVKSGVLVVRAGANSPFKLQDGDVILTIDGRTPSSAQHAGRILRSYADGEKFTLRIQRDRKAQNLDVTMPGPGADGPEH